MARISLLFSLAFVLALGSFFLSVSGHAPHGRGLTEAEYNVNSHIGADVKGFESIYEKFSHLFGGYLGGQAHRRELYTVGPDAAEAPAGEIAKDVSQSDFDKIFRYFYGDKIRSKAHRRELYIVGPTAEAPAGVNTAAPASETDKDVSQSAFDKYFKDYFGEKGRMKAHRRGLYTQSSAAGNVKGSFEDFFNVGFGGKVQYDAAGKMKVAGKDGFRSLNRAHYKHFASTEA